MKLYISIIGAISLTLFGVFFILLFTLSCPPDWFNRLNSLSTFFLVIVGALAFIAAAINALFTRSMVDNMAKQLEEIQRQQLPAITIKIVPTSTEPNILNVVIQNTGKSPAYNISTIFSPDLPYRQGMISELSVFKSLPVLAPDEKLEFFFASAIDYFNSDSPKSSKATISYYTSQSVQNNSKKYTTVNQIDLTIYMGQLFVTTKSLNHIIDEVSELRRAIVLLLANIENKL